MCQIILPYSLLHVTWTLCVVNRVLPSHATWPPSYGPSHFKQLDMEDHAFYSRVCVIICVWKFSTEFPTKMVNLNNLLLTFTLN